MSAQATDFAPLHNARAVARADVPRLELELFQRAILQAPVHGRRVASLFGAAADGGGVELFAVLAADSEGVLEVASTVVRGGAFPSMTRDCPQVHLFERVQGGSYPAPVTVSDLSDPGVPAPEVPRRASGSGAR